jgi:uncharacterized protein YukE
MAANHVQVDAEALAKATPEVLRLASRVKAVFADLESTTSALGECWGDDEGGRRFAEQYLKPKTQILEGLESASKVLDSMADGLSTMSKGYRKTEDQATEAANTFK